MRLGLAVALMLVLGRVASAQEVGPIVAETIVDASPEIVWAAWATGPGLESWLAPHADIEMKIGGRMRTNASATGSLDDPQVIENAVLSFEPGRMLSIRVARPPATFPFPNAVKQMWTVMYFEPSGTGRTRVRVVGMGFDASDESQKMRAFFARGNQTTLDQLQRHFASNAR